MFDILDAVFRGWQGQGKLVPAWRFDIAERGIYPARSLTTQYQEANLAFAERLMHEEGCSIISNTAPPPTAAAWAATRWSSPTTTAASSPTHRPKSASPSRRRDERRQHRPLAHRVAPGRRGNRPSAAGTTAPCSTRPVNVSADDAGNGAAADQPRFARRLCLPDTREQGSASPTTRCRRWRWARKRTWRRHGAHVRARHHLHIARPRRCSTEADDDDATHLRHRPRACI